MLTWTQSLMEVTILILNMTKTKMMRQIKGDIPNTPTRAWTKNKTRLAGSLTSISSLLNPEKSLLPKVIFNRSLKLRFAGTGKCRSVLLGLNAHLLTVNMSYFKSLTSIQIIGQKSATISMRNSTAPMEIGANFTMRRSQII